MGRPSRWTSGQSSSELCEPPSGLYQPGPGVHELPRRLCGRAMRRLEEPLRSVGQPLLAGEAEAEIEEGDQGVLWNAVWKGVGPRDGESRHQRGERRYVLRPHRSCCFPIAHTSPTSSSLRPPQARFEPCFALHVESFVVHGNRLPSRRSSSRETK